MATWDGLRFPTWLMFALFLVAAGGSFALGRSRRLAMDSELLLAEQRAHRETAARADTAMRRARASAEACRRLTQQKTSCLACPDTTDERMPGTGATELVTPEVPDHEPPDHEGLAAFEQAEQLVNDARRRAMWTQQDANAMRTLNSKLVATQRREIVDRLVTSINTDELRLADDVDAPFF